MPLMTEVRRKADFVVRTRAEAVIGSARSSLDFAGHVFTSAADDARGRLESVADAATANGVAGRVTTTAASLFDRSLEQARKQALVTVGAGDLVLETLTTRTEELTHEVQRGAGKGVATASSRVRSARVQAAAGAASARARGGQVVVTVRRTERPGMPTVPAVRGVIESRVTNARGMASGRYDQLAERGGNVVRSVRRDRRVLDTVTGADHASEELADELSSVAGELRYRAAANARSVRARKGAATRARSAAVIGAAEATSSEHGKNVRAKPTPGKPARGGNASVKTPERSSARTTSRDAGTARASATHRSEARTGARKPTAEARPGARKASAEARTGAHKASAEARTGAHKASAGKPSADRSGTAADRSGSRRTTARPASAAATAEARQPGPAGTSQPRGPARKSAPAPSRAASTP